MSAEGWGSTPWPREHHEHLLALVRADNGGTLPAWALSVDLVYLADRANHPSKKHAFPGRRELERRWGTSERETRNALRAPEWQAVCTRFRIALPDRQLRGNVPVGVPQASPLASPLASQSGTSQRQETAENVPVAVPVAVPPASPSLSTRARPSPRLHVSTSNEQDMGSASPDPGLPLAPQAKPKAVTPQTRTPEKATVLDLWGATYTATTGETYPWSGDKGYRQALAHAHDILAIIGDVSPPKLERLRRCIEGYLENPHPWAQTPPEGQGRTLRDFTRQAQDRWTRLAPVRTSTTSVSAMPPPEPKAPDPPPRSFRRHVVPNPIPPSHNHHLDLLK